MKIVTVTPENAEKHTFFCIKNTKEPGFHAKLEWFTKRIAEGLMLKVMYAEDGKQVGFIEYLPVAEAWRPVAGNNWLFIHCIMVYPNKYRNTGAATGLVEEAIRDAEQQKMNGVCTMTSRGPWMATKKLFARMGFEKVDKKGRFELMALPLSENTALPSLIDWESRLVEYKGWHLLYADQCPWHDKGVKEIMKAAADQGIELQVKKIENSADARKMPSGFGVFALVKDGKLLEDHYISKTRFMTILKNEQI